jgi:hypothetical protein
MRAPILILLVCTLIAVSSSAAPTISGVTPNTGPVAGGTVVTITGTGFSTCNICSPPLPPAVFFGGVPATSVEIINPETLRVVTPPHPARTVDVTVDQFDGRVALAQAFTFTGELADGFEAFLVPIFSPPIQGAFGSEFRTVVRASNRSDALPLTFYGLDTACFLLSPVLGPNDARFIGNNRTEMIVDPACSTWPAVFLYVPTARAEDFAVNLRVRDVSRNAMSHGTEIPVVRESGFRNRIVLLGAPIDEHFRNTLRIYSAARVPVTVLVAMGGEEHFVTLQPGENEFEPAYAVFTDFLRPGEVVPSPDFVRITIDSLPSGGVTHPIWAFVSVTNNVTQEITTITP